MAEDNIPDTLKDLTDQFKEMHESLDKLAESQKPVVEEAKVQLARTRRPAHAPTQAPKVEFGKETRKDILAALKGIRQQIVVSQRKENTAADVAAEHLAAGGGLAGAAGEAIAFKAGKFKAAFKRKFDPLNIVNRISGGSKLATALAGRLMGRSEKSIRAASGLGGGLPGMEMQDQYNPSPYTQQDNAPSAVSSEKATGLLEQISSTMSAMLDQMTELNASISKIEDYSKETTKFAEDQVKSTDQLKDAEAAERVKKQQPSQVRTAIAPTTKKEEAGGGLFGSFMKELFTPQGLAIAAAVTGIVAAIYSVVKNWEALKDAVADIYESIKSGFMAVKDWIANKITGALDSALDTVDSVVDSIKDIGNSINPFAEKVTPEQRAKEKHTRRVQAAAAGSGHAQRALEKEVRSSEDSSEVLKKLAPNYISKIPNENRDASVASLRSGELVDSAMKSLKGEEPPKGTPAQVSTTNALTQMVGKAYGELYKDAQGNALRPSQDKNVEARLPSLMQSASQALAEATTPQGSPARTSSVIGAPMMAPVPSAPMMLPPPPPQTGQLLNQSAENQRNAAASGAGTNNVVAPVINQNKTVNNTSQTTIHQNMPPARSGESSFLRSQDGSFARA